MSASPPPPSLALVGFQPLAGGLLQKLPPLVGEELREIPSHRHELAARLLRPIPGTMEPHQHELGAGMGDHAAARGARHPGDPSRALRVGKLPFRGRGRRPEGCPVGIAPTALGLRARPERWPNRAGGPEARGRGGRCVGAGRGRWTGMRAVALRAGRAGGPRLAGGGGPRGRGRRWPGRRRGRPRARSGWGLRPRGVRSSGRWRGGTRGSRRSGTRRRGGRRCARALVARRGRRSVGAVRTGVAVRSFPGGIPGRGRGTHASSAAGALDGASAFRTSSP